MSKVNTNGLVKDVHLISIEKIRADVSMQARVGLDHDTVTEYATLLESSVDLPPMDTVEDAEGWHWLWDGFHRHLSHKAIGNQMVHVRSQPGTREDAQWLALSANRTHGLKRTNEDKRRAATLALTQKPEMSDRSIGDHVGVSHPFVADIRKQLVTVTSCSEAEPNSRVGVDGKTRRLPVKQADPFDDDQDEAELPTVGSSAVEQPIEDAKEHPLDWPDDPTTSPGREAIEEESPVAVPADEAGQELPGKCVEAFAAVESLKHVCTQIERCARSVQEVKTSAAGTRLMVEQIVGQLRGAKNTLMAARPYRLCPYCLGKKKFCTACKDLGWVSKMHWDAIPAKDREAS